jgi:phage terminase large subunit-like protein
VIDGVYFDARSVALDCAFIESLTLTKSTKSGRPEPFRLLPPHRKVVANLLGWKRPDGTRLYRRCYFSVARKNAKTQISAALGLDLLVLDDEASPEIYIAAKDRDQSGICFRAAADMVYAHEELRDVLKVVEYQKAITNPLNGGVLRALSSEGKGKHGLNPSTVIIDEFHVWGSPEQELYDALTTGSGARRQPLTIIITTAGVDEYTLCGREYEYACRVRDGLIEDPTYLPLIYELPKDADWSDEDNWRIANPTLGDIVRVEYLREECAKAKNVPSEQTKFRRLNCNQWVNSTDIWIPLMQWDACTSRRLKGARVTAVSTSPRSTT